MPLVSASKLIVYTSPTCPDRQDEKAWLKQARIAFEERDLSDQEVAAEAEARTGVRAAPLTLEDGAFFYAKFASQKLPLPEALSLSNTV